jgi:hypothetical protein
MYHFNQKLSVISFWSVKQQCQILWDRADINMLKAAPFGCSYHATHQRKPEMRAP